VESFPFSIVNLFCFSDFEPEQWVYSKSYFEERRLRRVKENLWQRRLHLLQETKPNRNHPNRLE
jgi:hypothetical protein